MKVLIWSIPQKDNYFVQEEQKIRDKILIYLSEFKNLDITINYFYEEDKIEVETSNRIIKEKIEELIVGKKIK